MQGLEWTRFVRVMFVEGRNELVSVDLGSEYPAKLIQSTFIASPVNIVE